VARWLAAEPPPLAPEDRHWLPTFTRLVADELLEIAAVRVVPEDAVAREWHRQKLDEHLFKQPDRTNAGLGLRILGSNLQVSWLISGTLVRTGAVWTAQARVVDARSGKFQERFSATATNWFELRDQVVRHVLRRLDIVPSPAEEKRLGKACASSPRALDLFSRAMSEAKDKARAVELCRKALAEDPRLTEAGGLLVAGLPSKQQVVAPNCGPWAGSQNRISARTARHRPQSTCVFTGQAPWPSLLPYDQTLGLGSSGLGQRSCNGAVADSGRGSGRCAAGG
jgi:hypothetical protein